MYTGLRPGEKLYEELLMESETTIPTSYKSIMVCVGEEVTKEEVAQKLDLLEDNLDSSDEEIKRVLQQVVPNYVPDMSTR